MTSTAGILMLIVDSLVKSMVGLTSNVAAKTNDSLSSESTLIEGAEAGFRP